jgi:hypothetical protein
MGEGMKIATAKGQLRGKQAGGSNDRDSALCR